jgi:hypothetical protein
MTPQEITAADFPEIAAFFDRQLAKTLPSPGPAMLMEYLKWIERNPARDGLPMGWILRENGAIAGQIFCIPQPFMFRGKKRIFALVSHLFVEPAAQNGGAMLLLKFRQLQKNYPLLGATVNTRSMPFWKAIGARPLAGSDFEYLKVLDWGPVAAEALSRTLPLSLANAIGPVASVANIFSAGTAAPGALQAISASEAAAVFLSAAEEVSIDHGADFLGWRTQSPFYTSSGIHRFTTPSGSDVCVMTAIRPRGQSAEGRLRSLCILDIWGKLSAATIPELMSALAAEFRAKADVIEARDLGSRFPGAYESAGCRKRSFTNPSVWILDREGIPGAHPWLLMPSATDLM